MSGMSRLRNENEKYLPHSIPLPAGIGDDDVDDNEKSIEASIPPAGTNEKVNQLISFNSLALNLLR